MVIELKFIITENEVNFAVNTNPNKLYSFDDYYSSQREIKLFIVEIQNRKPGQYNISGC
jgi:hypothetical protein